MAKEINILSKDGKENYYPRTKSQLVHDSLTDKTVDELIHDNLYDLIGIKAIVGSCRNLNNPNKQEKNSSIYYTGKIIDSNPAQKNGYRLEYCVTDYIRLYKGIPITTTLANLAKYNIYDLDKNLEQTITFNGSSNLVYIPSKDGYVRFSSTIRISDSGEILKHYAEHINYGTEIIDEPYNDKLDDIATNSRVDEVEAKVDDAASTISSHTTAIQSLEGEVAKIDGINKTLQDHSSLISANKESCTVSKEKIEELQESFSNHIRKFDEMGEAVLHHSNQISDIEDDVTGHTQQISDIQTSIEDCQRQIENLKDSTPPDTPDPGTSGSTSSADIEALKRTVSEQGTSIQTLSSKVSGNTEQIDQLKTTSGEHGESIASLLTDTQNNAKLIGQLSPKVTANTRTILDLSSQTESNTEKISTIETQVDKNAANITNIESKILTNAKNISAISTQANSNAQQIEAVRDRVDSNTDYIGTVENKADANAKLIADLLNRIKILEDVASSMVEGCFGTGVWDNSMPWQQVSKWENDPV